MSNFLKKKDISILSKKFNSDNFFIFLNFNIYSLNSINQIKNLNLNPFIFQKMKNKYLIFLNSFFNFSKGGYLYFCELTEINFFFKFCYLFFNKKLNINFFPLFLLQKNRILGFNLFNSRFNKMLLNFNKFLTQIYSFVFLQILFFCKFTFNLFFRSLYANN